MENKSDVSHDPEIKKLGELIKDVRIAMLTTTNEDQQLHSSPLMTQEVDFDGDLWFLVSKTSQKISDIRRDDRVNVSYASSHGKFVSLSGVAELVEDLDKVKEIWSKSYEAWFPDGPTDSRIQLLKINIETAEYWESHTSPIAKMLELTKVATGKPQKMGDHKVVDLKH